MEAQAQIFAKLEFLRETLYLINQQCKTKLKNLQDELETQVI